MSITRKMVCEANPVSLNGLSFSQQMAMLEKNGDWISPQLFLGNFASFKNMGSGNPNDFALVVNVSHQDFTDPTNKEYFTQIPGNVTVLHPGKGLGDVAEAWSLLESRLPIVLTEIDNALMKGLNVLVNCTQGVSRSATVVISYVMAKFNVTYDQAFTFVQSKRPQIEPNSGFVRGLQSFHWTFASDVHREQQEGKYEHDGKDESDGVDEIDHSNKHPVHHLVAWSPVTDENGVQLQTSASCQDPNCGHDLANIFCGRTTNDSFRYKCAQCMSSFVIV